MDGSDIALAKVFSDNPAKDNIAAAAFDSRNKLIQTSVSIAKEEAEYPFYKGGQSQIYFYKDRVIFSEKCVTSVVWYSHALKAFETDEYFFIYVTERKIFAVPKKGFMFPEETGVVANLLEMKLGAKFKKKGQ